MGGYQQYQYELFDLDPERPLKIIRQPLFDHAAEHGFPPDFFKDSFFYHVAFRTFPEGVDCSFSTFAYCSFKNCSIKKCVFDHADICSTTFDSSTVRMSNFTEAVLSDTHFQNSALTSVSFQGARLYGFQAIDCRMERIDFQGARLAGDSYMFVRIDAHNVLNLHRATIAQGGASDEELRQIRTAIFRELGVPLFRVKRWPIENKRGKNISRKGELR